MTQATYPAHPAISDHDPQVSAYDYNVIGRAMWYGRLPLYRLMGRGGHRAEDNEQKWAFETEIHHKPGDGVTRELFERVLRPSGFTLEICAHNNRVGDEALNGSRGRSPAKIRVAQRLSGIHPDSADGALTLMCVARRQPD